MNAIPIQSFLANLEKRRRALDMPWDALAGRSGVSRATVIRLLKENHTGASLQNVIAVAEALGVGVEFDDVAFRSKPIDVAEFIDQQAGRQARKLVGMVQGTMGLEAQALQKKQAAPLIQRTKRRLLAGSKKKLWYD